MAPLVAKADTVQLAISSATPVSGDATLTTVADPTVAGAQDITSISGTFDGVGISGIVPDTASGTITFPDTFYFTYDNLLFPGEANIFDSNGLALQLTNGVDINIATDPVKGLVYEAFDGYINFDQETYTGVPISATISGMSVTPEPSSIALLGTGLLGIAGVLRRRHA